jgi:hypothetical protein
MKNTYFIIWIACIYLVLSSPVMAQISIGGQPGSWKQVLDTNTKIFQQTFPSPDLAVLEKEDKQDEINGEPPRFGFMNETNINLLSDECKVIENEQISVWKLEIICQGALSINFVFDKFYIPQGGKLFIYSADRKQLIGAFTHLNNKGTLQELRGFGTGLIYGERVILEYEQPKEVETSAVINISGVVHGYRYIRTPNNSKSISSFGTSGPCQVNVNCPEGNNWQNEKRGIAMILVGGIRWCTGSLINNTSNNGDLLFLTADHCRAGRDAVNNPYATDWSFWWDYESPNCNNPTSEPIAKVTNGATFLANYANSDFALLRLMESPLAANPPINVYFNGWDRSTSHSAGGAGIHHPRGDIKKIATHYQVPGPGQVYGATTHWRVMWSPTPNGYSVTEGGSSGSPLFNSQKKIIGQLHGGSPINCSDPANDPGEYGRFDVSWTGGGLNTNRLSNWLDPANTGAMSVDGGYFNNCPQTISITNPINAIEVYHTSSTIFASSTVAPGATLAMKAEDFIEFLPGFGAFPGSNMRATIEPCTAGVLPAASRQAVDNDFLSVIEQEKPELTLYPNPTSGNLNIELKVVETGEINFKLFNLVGDELQQWKTQCSDKGSYTFEANLIPYPPGVYLISVSGKNLHFNRKIVKN